jgi:hypothetical protein
LRFVHARAVAGVLLADPFDGVAKGLSLVWCVVLRLEPPYCVDVGCGL